ncbi:hypothetical protein D3C84_1004020 [compost metagenome]
MHIGELQRRSLQLKIGIQHRVPLLAQNDDFSAQHVLIKAKLLFAIVHHDKRKCCNHRYILLMGITD